MEWSRSGAGVRLVRTAAGQEAYRKVMPGSAAARRELRFYRELAPLVPVRTPELLAGEEAEEGVTLLLASAGERVEIAAWTTEMWAELGRELAALHSMPLPPGAEWNRPDALLEAIAAPDLAGIEAFWPPSIAGGRIRAELLKQLRSQPTVFTHGDCHTDNIVRSGDSLVFCDWQLAGVARPASDLAFLSVRATPAGVPVAPALLDAYRASRPCDARALVAEELAVLVFLWPPYAAFNGSDGIARIRRRAEELTALL
jgi:aminoglycoside phosphotransferase (APT) family kinase protein